MNVVKCSNGHFFDGDSYQVCPHCGAPVGGLSPTQPPEMKEKRKGLFGKKTREATSGTPISQFPGNANGYISPESHYTSEVSGFGDGRTPTVDLPQEQTPQTPEPSKKKDVTLDFWQTSSSPAPITPDDIPKQPESPVEQPVDGFAPAPQNDKAEEPVTTPEIPVQETPSTKKTESLLDQVRNASATAEGKTMSYFSAVTGESTATKPKASGTPAPIDPVVGWLVCIKGEHFGESFNIGAGMNSIGRNEGNRIVLDRDLSVSREKHALITYEPKHCQFYVKPGDSSGLTYVNDEYITETKRINAKDIIELGNCKFVFVPLCGDDFTWEDYMKGQ